LATRGSAFPIVLGQEELSSPDALKATFAEGIATLLFVFVGVGSIMAFGASFLALADASAFLGIAFAHGLTIALLVTAIGRISGGHINPAVTFGAVVTGKVSVTRGGMYIVAQLIGAVIGAALIKIFIVGELVDAMGLGAHAINDEVVRSAMAGLGIEAVLTFVLVWTVFATAGDPRGNQVIAPLAIGFAVLVIHLAAVPLTGAGVNPARSFGPALVQGEWTDHWIYWIGPLLGGTIAALTYHFVYLTETEEPARAA
jgi:MIP family channel proteins